MEDERTFAQMFDQMRIDARRAVSDDEAGQPPVRVVGNTLQIVRRFDTPGGAPRIQIVRYLISSGRVVRYASPPISDARVLRSMLADGGVDGWSSVPLMRARGRDYRARLRAQGRLDHQHADRRRRARQEQRRAQAADRRQRAARALGHGARGRHRRDLAARVPIKRVFLVGE